MSEPSEDLREIGELLLTQDNRATSEPIYLVQQKRRIYAIEDHAADGFLWSHCGETVSSDLGEILEKGYKAGGEIPDDYHRTGYIEIWEYVMPFFTEVGAEAYLAANRHNLRSPEVYVASGYRNPEWIALREFLRGLAAQETQA
jgi:hypothetical protein